MTVKTPTKSKATEPTEKASPQSQPAKAAKQPTLEQKDAFTYNNMDSALRRIMKVVADAESKKNLWFKILDKIPLVGFLCSGIASNMKVDTVSQAMKNLLETEPNQDNGLQTFYYVAKRFAKQAGEYQKGASAEAQETIKMTAEACRALCTIMKNRDHSSLKSSQDLDQMTVKHANMIDHSWQKIINEIEGAKIAR